MRLTQDKTVTVTRYITKDTIEEVRLRRLNFQIYSVDNALQAVQDRQSKKMELAELTLNRDIGSEDQIQKRFFVSFLKFTVDRSFTKL
jgi:SNF2 family DNA or RNA helicase